MWNVFYVEGLIYWVHFINWTQFGNMTLKHYPIQFVLYELSDSAMWLYLQKKWNILLFLCMEIYEQTCLRALVHLATVTNLFQMKLFSCIYLPLPEENKIWNTDETANIQQLREINVNILQDVQDNN